MNVAKQYLDLVNANNELGYITMLYVVSGDISFSEASEIFRQGEKNYKMIGQGLNDMVVPDKYIGFHTHFINSVKYAEEAYDLLERGYQYENVDLIERATLKIELATTEMETAVYILEVLN